MNERIRELALQARKYADENEEHWKPGPSWDSLFEGKFVELIVKECLGVVGKEHKLALEFDWDNDDTATSIKDGIKKHFGVE